MPRKTLALISGLVLLTLILFIIALRTAKQSLQTQQMQPTVMQPAPTSPAHSVLALSPNPVIVASGQQGTADVTITTSDNLVTAVQLEIAYDPHVITQVKVTPGALFPNPVVLINKNDTQTGRMTYAFGITPNHPTVNGTGSVATINFTATGTPGQQSQLALLPTSLVTARGIAQSVLQSETGTLITIAGQGTPGTMNSHMIMQPSAMMQPKTIQPKTQTQTVAPPVRSGY